jgi:GT2 family glycosyltransferase
MQANRKVSIIIVNRNRADLTRDCVDAIVKHTDNALYEIIVVDNGSTAAEVETLVRASLQNFELIPLNRNMFFGEANNIGAENATGEYVLFINNDVNVTHGWLNQLLTVLNNEFCAGAVGPKFLYPDGKLQEAGAYIRSDGWALQLGKGGMTLPPGYVDTIQVVDYCSAACLLMRKSDFLNLGGFDPIFDPAYFEDTDLALRLRSLGLLTYYCGQAIVYHQAEVTSRVEWTTERLNGFISANHDRFVKRWGGFLKRRLDKDCEPDALPPLKWEPERASSALNTALLYSSIPLVACETSRRLLEVASALEELFDVVIAADERFSRCRVYSLCREFGVALNSFRVRGISEIDQSSCATIVTFGGNGSADHISGPYLIFERAGHKLLQFIENQ